MNLEGRVQRLRRAVTPPVPDELAWLAKLASRLDTALSPHAAVVFEELSARIYDSLDLSTVGERAPLPARAPYVAPEPRAGAGCAACRDGWSRPLRGNPPPPPLSAALLGVPRRARSRAPVPAPRARSHARRRRTPTGAGSRPATSSPSARTARRSSCARASTGSSSRASRASPRSTPPTSTSTSRWSRRDVSWIAATGDAGEPWWIAVIKSLIVINLVLFGFAYLTLIERKVMGRMQLRYGPNRAGPYGLTAADRRPREADPQGELLPGGRDRRPLHRRAVPRGVHGAHDLLGDPVGTGLGDRRLPGERLRRRPPDRAAPHLRRRLDRDLRLHHRRLGLRLEVLPPRVDADVRAARLVRGVARAFRARRRS